MNSKKKDILTWDVGEIARALKISEKDVREYFTNGRRVSFILERRIAKEVVKGKLAPSEGAGFDLIDAQGGKWEVRSISGGGVYFCPSYMVGSGRSFDEGGFLRKLSELKGYIVSDIELFPNIRFWVVTSEQVRKWWDAGKLGTTTKITRQRALKLLSEQEQTHF